jgi:hypothetical protein
VTDVSPDPRVQPSIDRAVSDAKTQWCPFAFALVAGVVVNRTDRTGEIPPECRCLVDKCSLWIASAVGIGHCGMSRLS